MRTIAALARVCGFAAVMSLLAALPAQASIISYVLGVTVPVDGSVDVAVDEGGLADLRFVDSFIPDVFHSVDLDGLDATYFWATPDSFWAAPLANPFDSTATTATDPSLFIDGFNGTNPWMMIDGPAYVGGVFDLAGSLHQFYVLLTMNVGTGEILLDEVGYDSDVFGEVPAEVPEPSTIALLAVGAAGLIAARRRAR